MFRHHKSLILIIIIILFLIKLENPLHHTGIVSNNQEPGAVSDVYYEELIKDINIFDLYRKSNQGEFKSLATDLENSFDKQFCADFQKFPVTTSFLEWKNYVGTPGDDDKIVEQIPNTNLFKVNLPDMEAKSGLNIFTGVGNIYFKKPKINKSGQKSEPIISNSSRFDLCKNRFTVVDKQACPEVVLPKLYKPENFMSKGNIKIADKLTCLKNMETAGVNDGKLEANLEECSCFDGDENWEHYRFYPEYEKYTNLIVYFMIAVCLWIFIAMAYRAFKSF